MEQRIQINSKSKPGSLNTILWAGLVAGLLDGIASSIMLYIKLGLNPGQVMQYVASALYGPSAFAGGTPMILIGTVLHFMIAITIAAIYLYLYPKVKMLRSAPVLSGLSLGLVTWAFMNLIIVPFSRTQPAPIEAGAAAISITLHMILVGLPISLIIKRHFDKQL
jgi:uncharacterized membrane protein YagU involved in acid resistance